MGLGPELNILVDHAISQFRKGALGLMVVNPAGTSDDDDDDDDSDDDD